MNTETDQATPESEDYVLTPSGTLSAATSVSIHEGAFLGEFPTQREALVYVASRMDDIDRFWPNVWWCSDHGNLWQIDSEGNEVKS